MRRAGPPPATPTTPTDPARNKRTTHARQPRRDPEARTPSHSPKTARRATRLTHRQLRARSGLAVYTLRPWATRLEKAISNCTALCPGGTYVSLDFDGLLRASPEQRAQQYTAALNDETGWMRREEVRALEDLPPEETQP
jgi:phage portal protein BeeE